MADRKRAEALYIEVMRSLTSNKSIDLIASALRAQYVAGLSEALRAINSEARLWDGACAEPFPGLRRRIRELAEQAKRG